MGKPAAKQGDKIKHTHQHEVQPPSGPTFPDVFEFAGPISGTVSPNVLIAGQPAAVVGSTATSEPHVAKGGTFVSPPSLTGVITAGSTTVMINGKPAARDGDAASACGLTGATVVAGGSVHIG